MTDHTIKEAALSLAIEATDIPSGADADAIVATARTFESYLSETTTSTAAPDASATADASPAAPSSDPEPVADATPPAPAEAAPEEEPQPAQAA